MAKPAAKPKAKPIPGVKPKGDGSSPKTAQKSESTKRLQAHILQQRRDYPDEAWEALAERLGYGRPYIYKLFKEALQDIIREPAEEIIAIELERMDVMYSEVMRILRAFHPVVSQGRIIKDTVEDENGRVIFDESGKPVLIRLSDASPKLAAIDRALKLMERRAKLLGLDKQGDPNKAGMTADEFASKILGAVQVMDAITGATA